MATKAKKNDPLILLPIPLSIEDGKQKKQFLIEQLKQLSLEQIVLREVDTIYTWRQLKNGVLKRAYRNYSLVYSPVELHNYIMASYQAILLSEEL